MLDLCPYCAQTQADFCIPEFQDCREFRVFKMCLYESANFFKHPFKFWQGNILSSIFDFKKLNMHRFESVLLRDDELDCGLRID
jgi:hypothetical protein